MPKLKVISLFAGAGGVDVGFKKAGFEIIWANDFDENAVNTFKLNLGDHIVLGDITQISSDQIPNDVDVITGGFPCFVAGTKIYTEQGYKNIEDIVVGDRVLTHKNRFQKVVIRMVNQTKEIYKIKAMGIPEIETTHNHPFYVMQKDWSEPQWIDAKDLNKNHYLSIPINNYSKLPNLDDITNDEVNNNSFLKDGFLWLPFRTKEILVKDATVYNFEVEEDNSYTANNAVVHNCQGFSVANTKRSIDDKRNFLYKELLRVVKDKKPKYFIAENVKGLLSLSGGLVMKMIEDDFREIGYNMNYRLLNSADYGVPQLRERVIIIGNRLGLPNPFPEPTHMKQERDNDNLFSFVSNLLPHRTVKNSIGYLENIETVERNSNQIIEINGKKIHNHIAYTNVDNIFWKREGDTTQEEICDYLKYWRDKKGISTKRIDEIFGYRHTAGHWFRKDNNSGSIPKPSDWWKLKEILGFDDKYDKFVTNLVEKEIIFEQSLRITNWNRPSDTITASTPEIHINKKRRLSVRECAILQTFPDDFIFTGSLSAQHRQVGNAVPPLLAEKIALEIRKVLEINNKD